MPDAGADKSQELNLIAEARVSSKSLEPLELRREARDKETERDERGKNTE